MRPQGENLASQERGEDTVALAANNLGSGAKSDYLAVVNLDDGASVSTVGDINDCIGVIECTVPNTR